MKTPIVCLKTLARKHNLTHIITFVRDEKGEDCISTYGETIEQSAQAAEFGNKMKAALKWPESLQAQPERLIRLQKENEELRKKIEKITGAIDCEKCEKS